MKNRGLQALLLAFCFRAGAQPATPREPAAIVVLKAARTFDGESTHEGWAVRIKGDRIDSAGPAASIDASGANVIELPGTTLMPGLVEGHSHILLARL